MKPSLSVRANHPAERNVRLPSLFASFFLSSVMISSLCPVRRETEQPRRVCFQHERPHVVANGNLLEVRQPAIGSDPWIVGTEEHLVLEQCVRVLNQGRRKVLRRPSRKIDVDLRLVQADGY